MWRSLFVVTIAIPQFVTLLLVGKMFGDYGIVNSICSKIGLTQVLQNLGLVGKGLFIFPFIQAWLGACHDRVNQYLGGCTVSDAECHGNPFSIFQRNSWRVQG